MTAAVAQPIYLLLFPRYCLPRSPAPNYRGATRGFPQFCGQGALGCCVCITAYIIICTCTHAYTQQQKQQHREAHKPPRTRTPDKIKSKRQVFTVACSSWNVPRWLSITTTRDAHVPPPLLYSPFLIPLDHRGSEGREEEEGG